MDVRTNEKKNKTSGTTLVSETTWEHAKNIRFNFYVSVNVYKISIATALVDLSHPDISN